MIDKTITLEKAMRHLHDGETVSWWLGCREHLLR